MRRSFSASRFNLHLGAVGQLAHDVVQHVRRHRHGAGLRDVGRRLVRHLALEVGGLELQRPLRGLEQDVGQDGNGRAPLDHARHVAEGSQKLTAFDHQLHEPASPVAPFRGAQMPPRCGRAKVFAKSRKPRICREDSPVPAGWTATRRLCKGRRPPIQGSQPPQNDAGAALARRSSPLRPPLETPLADGSVGTFMPV